jgi:hypothetical protein
MPNDFWKKYFPHTTAIGFIKADFFNLHQAFSSWRTKINDENVISVEDGSLDYMFKKLKPLQMPIKKVLFCQTNSEWIAYFDDGRYGSDPFPPVTYMAEVLECEAVLIDFSENTVKSDVGQAEGTYGSVQFALYSPESQDFFLAKRAVGAVNDGGKWVFIDEGDPLPFEDISRYSAKKIADRFDRKMLESYCQALGIDPYNEQFYGSRFFLSRPLEDT